jgi:hypothetical protein
MIITTKSGLAIASLPIRYNGKSILLKNVLLDTGCAVTIFDTDAVEPLGLVPDRKKARLVRMTGIGGKSDFCIQQKTEKLTLDGYIFYQFPHQLGSIREPYGFNAIFGNDVLTASGWVNWTSLSLSRAPLIGKGIELVH